jgi:hypothetical protein
MRLLQIPNHGVQQREINNARDTNGAMGMSSLPVDAVFLCHFEILGIVFAEA